MRRRSQSPAIAIGVLTLCSAMAGTARAQDADTADGEQQQTNDKTRSTVETPDGHRIAYGPTLSVVRIGVRRPSDEPARERDYEPFIDVVPAQIGFEVSYMPNARPWRQDLDDGSDLQIISADMSLLLEIESPLRHGAISLGAGFSFIQRAVGVALTFDLYRGIPVLSPSGVEGEGTAYTGLLAWALSPTGEVTPENVSLVVTIGLEPLVNAISGVSGGDS